MDLGYLYTSFEGRINRKPYWLGTLALVVVALVAWLIVFFALGIAPGSGSTGAAVLQLVFLLVIGYPVTALMIKRLHDRNRPAILAAVFWAPSVLQILGQLLGITGEMTDVGGTAVYMPNTLGWVIMLLSVVIGIWALIELGILRGSRGPNRFGADPLARA